jgi:hypothetical protein
MGAGQSASMDTGLRAAAANCAAVRPAPSQAQARRGERTKSVRVTIVLALFVALVAAAGIVGRAMIDPVLRTVLPERDGRRVAAVLYSLPDGSFCRRLAFDNGTATLTRGAVEQCPANLPKERLRGDRNFAWGAR